MGSQNVLLGEFKQMVPPDDYVGTAPTGGTLISVDTRGFRFCHIVLNLGTCDTITAEVQDSADNSTFADLDDPVVFDAISTVNDNGVRVVMVDTQKTDRYLRIVFNTFSGAANNVGAVAFLSEPTDSANVDALDDYTGA